jgi:hypothetical protein
MVKNASVSQLAFFISQILSKHYATLYNTALIMNPDYQLFSLTWLAVFKPRTVYKVCTAFKILWPLSCH